VHNPQQKANANLVNRMRTQADSIPRYFAQQNENTRKEKITFIAVGDWGEEDLVFQPVLAESMDKWSKKNENSLILSLGIIFIHMG